MMCMMCVHVYDVCAYVCVLGGGGVRGDQSWIIVADQKAVEVALVIACDLKLQ